MYRSHDTWVGPDDPQTISLNSAKVFLRANRERPVSWRVDRLRLAGGSRRWRSGCSRAGGCAKWPAQSVSHTYL